MVNLAGCRRSLGLGLGGAGQQGTQLSESCLGTRELKRENKVRE